MWVFKALGGEAGNRTGSSPLVEGAVPRDDMGGLWAQQEVDPLVERPSHLRVTDMLHIMCSSTSHSDRSDTQHDTLQNSVLCGRFYVPNMDREKIWTQRWAFTCLERHGHYQLRSTQRAAGETIFPRFQMLNIPNISSYS